jgi:hypothetical protein
MQHPTLPLVVSEKHNAMQCNVAEGDKNSLFALQSADVTSDAIRCCQAGSKTRDKNGQELKIGHHLCHTDPKIVEEYDFAKPITATQNRHPSAIVQCTNNKLHACTCIAQQQFCTTHTPVLGNMPEIRAWNFQPKTQ